LHHSFLSFPNRSDAQILNDFQRHQTAFVIFLSEDGREADASRIAGKAELILRKVGGAGIAAAKQFCQNISSWRERAGPAQRQAFKNWTMRMLAGFADVAEKERKSWLRGRDAYRIHIS
jgi:hypothetical protein